jgi:hypothetical protein
MIITIINKRKVNKENVHVFEALYFLLLVQTTIVRMCQNANTVLIIRGNLIIACFFFR